MLSGSNLHLDDDEYHLSGHDMDPSDLIIDYDDPIFYKQPTDAFVIKNQPATLHCRVSHALDVHFKVFKTPNKFMVYFSIILIFLACYQLN